MDRLWSPWRNAYVTKAGGETRGCVLCSALERAEAPESLVVHVAARSFVLMNLYPYNSGHLMVAPNAHIATPEALAAADLQEMGQLTSRCLAILKENFHPDGFNIGMNLGQAAGAGVKDHFHQHIVPRWQGDANFMAVIGETKVLSYDLATVFAVIRSAFAK